MIDITLFIIHYRWLTYGMSRYEARLASAYLRENYLSLDSVNPIETINCGQEYFHALFVYNRLQNVLAGVSREQELNMYSKESYMYLHFALKTAGMLVSVGIEDELKEIASCSKSNGKL